MITASTATGDEDYELQHSEKKTGDMYEDDEENEENIEGKAQYKGGRSEQVMLLLVISCCRCEDLC